jgi:hypothetical protein
VGAIRELRELWELEARLLGELRADGGTTVNIAVIANVAPDSWARRLLEQIPAPHRNALQAALTPASSAPGFFTEDQLLGFAATIIGDVAAGYRLPGIEPPTIKAESISEILSAVADLERVVAGARGPGVA